MSDSDQALRPVPPGLHGPTGYVNYGCRCEVCCAANSERGRRNRALRLASPVPGHVHGTNNGYSNYGCRCGPCVEAHAQDLRDLRARRARDRALAA